VDAGVRRHDDEGTVRTGSCGCSVRLYLILTRMGSAPYISGGACHVIPEESDPPRGRLLRSVRNDALSRTPAARV